MLSKIHLRIQEMYIANMRRLSNTIFILVCVLVIIRLVFLKFLISDLPVLTDGVTNASSNHVQSSRGLQIHKRNDTVPSNISEVAQLNTILEKERANILNELNFKSVEEREILNSLIPEKGGKPKIVLVATTWRSGSTFLGDLLNTNLRSFYSFEPLLSFGIRKEDSSKLAEKRVNILNNLMTCNFTNMTDYLEDGKKRKFMIQHNKRLDLYCKNKEVMCLEPEFYQQFCSLFPYHLIKTTRLRLNLTRTLAMSDEYELKVVVLVRDPRGTTQSRKHFKFCTNNPDCESLCDDLVSDYHAFKQLNQEFPDKYHVVRYEELALEPDLKSKELFTFLGFNEDANVSKRFLNEHTSKEKGTNMSTFRDSKTIPFKWRKQLSFKEILTIQEKCSNAMNLWGYRSLEEIEEFSKPDAMIEKNFNE